MKRLLFICHRVPYPPDKGERVRAYNQLKLLSNEYGITLAALAHGPVDFAAARHLEPLCRKIIVAPAVGRLGLLRGVFSILAGCSATEAFFRSPALHRDIDAQTRSEPFDLAIGYSSSTLPFLLTVPDCPKIMDLADVDSAKWSDYADASPPPMRWLYRRESRAVRKLENLCLQNCDAVLLVSQAEIQAMDQSSDKLLAVQNGVDSEYFTPRTPSDDAAPRLVFTGTMDYRPNVEGICWFVSNVWPNLKRDVPDICLDIVGRNPAGPVRRLAKISGVNVTGSVDDVRPYLSAAAVAIVPLLIARGIQNKILEAMAAARAVVASSPALEGLDLAVGKELLRADSPSQWHQAVLDLLADTDRRKTMQQAARDRVVADYTWPARLSPLISLCQRLTATPSYLPQDQSNSAAQASESAP